MLKRLMLATLLALSVAPAAAQEDVKASPACRHCGMDRQKFASSRMLIEYDDGSVEGTCSIRCAALDLAISLQKVPRAIKVADMDTKQLVDAEKASWVLVPGKPGVMTRNAKWAFAERPAAEAYAKASGGTLVTFDEAMKAAYDDMHQDNQMLREKRKMMKAKAAEKSH